MAESSAPVSQSPSESAPEATVPEPTDWPLADRRVQPDRRGRPTKPWDALRGHRQRRRGRRAGEQTDLYVDRLGRRGIALALAIFALNLFDALCTMLWLGRGGSEGNPLMHMALEAGDAVFLFQKCFVAAVWVIVLVVHKNFRLARIGLWSLFAIYLLLGVYHGFLAFYAEPVPVPAPKG